MLKRLPIILTLAIAALVFMFRLGNAPIVTSHEARVADTALTMADSGLPWDARKVTVPANPSAGADSRPLLVNPWIIPVFEGNVRLQKPPLPYWCAAISYLALGPSEFSARLVPSLMGIIATVLVYLLARDLAGRRTAFWAALSWVTLFFAVDEYRKVMADPHLGFFTLLATVLWVRLCRHRPAGSQRDRLAMAAAFYAAIALGLLAKGPVVLVHVAVPATLFWLLYKQRPNLSRAAHVMGLAVLLLLLLPWPAGVWTEIPDVLSQWQSELASRFADERNARPWFFYLPALLQISLPWTPVFAIGVYLAIKRPRRRALLISMLWMAVIALFFTFVPMKKNAYLLPIMPALAILIGRVLAMAAAWSKGKLRGIWPTHLLNVQQIMGAAMGIGIAAILLVGPLEKHPAIGQIADAARQRLAEQAPLVVLAVAAGILPLLLWRSKSIARRFLLQTCAYAVLIMLAIGYIDPQKAARREPLMDFNRSPPSILKAEAR